MNKQRIVIIMLAVALFSLSQYIIYEKITESKQIELQRIFQNGYDKGLEDTVTTIYKQTDNCQTTTISVGNFTKTIFDLSCLKTQPKNMTR